MIYILHCKNSEVTDFYLNIVGDMMKGYDTVEFCDSIPKQKNKNDIAVVSTEIDFVKTYRLGYRNIFCWMQGISSEESYLKHNSKLRKFVLDRITKFSLKKAKGIFYVSEEMRRFEDAKFKLSTEKKSFIMPCFNATLDSMAFHTSDKYAKNVFSYVGSLSKWQCFEETVDFYKQIEEKVPDAELRVYTFSVEQAKNILLAKGVKRYSVDCVPPEKMTETLSGVKFGFVLRDDISVNRVATPTKLSSYMAAGVIPIVSDCVRDFSAKTKDFQYVVHVEPDKHVPKKVFTLCSKEVSADDVMAEYRNFFAEYYNREFYIMKSEDWMREIINECRSKIL